MPILSSIDSYRLINPSDRLKIKYGLPINSLETKKPENDWNIYISNLYGL